ncbi:MAG: hypothetical protein P8J01_10655, partial [Acidimicrobiales bacterium]|nr:hypothetical protein [Acidimicrobiales bacterium]
MSYPCWQFRRVPTDGGIGGGNAAEYAFPNRSIGSLVREVIQNSNDQDLGGEPVKVNFEFIE